MQALTDFFNHPFFIVLGGLGILYSLIHLILTIWTWGEGIFPVWWRLGFGLAGRKIAIFAESEFESFKSMLVDSKLFKESNIVRIDKKSLQKADGITLLLVDWESFKSEMDEILRIKKDYAALIIYAPPGSLKPVEIEKINARRNSIIVNLRGRLLNDILTCMITTGLEK